MPTPNVRKTIKEIDDTLSNDELRLIHMLQNLDNDLKSNLINMIDLNLESISRGSRIETFCGNLIKFCFGILGISDLTKKQKCDYLKRMCDKILVAIDHEL